MLDTGGGSYEGQFKEGHFWGQGKETYPDGMCCSHSLRPFRLLDLSYLPLCVCTGSVYEGDFVQGKRHGKGIPETETNQLRVCQGSDAEAGCGV